ncbi:hypothetical protein [Amycolatopsis methanolica]|uniref:hypothetical protein n=1 Tax=Amycolatopsis methanolica TaxID=1814 RepID=UPI003431A9F0
MVRQENLRGLLGLMLLRVVLPSYSFLASYRANRLYELIRQVSGPGTWQRLTEAAHARKLSPKHEMQALSVLGKIAVHTGRDVGDLEPDDLLGYFSWSRSIMNRSAVGLHLAWQLLQDVGVIEASATLRGALLGGQRTPVELVDAYQVRLTTVRAVLVRYLEERRPQMDYVSFCDLTSNLVGSFWKDVETHPGIDTLQLPREVAAAWRERMRHTRRDGLGSRDRQDGESFAILSRVRSFYLHMQQWAVEDPSWAPYALPSPVSRKDIQGLHKFYRAQQARTHQRIRERVPHVQVLIPTPPPAWPTCATRPPCSTSTTTPPRLHG